MVAPAEPSSEETANSYVSREPGLRGIFASREPAEEGLIRQPNRRKLHLVSLARPYAGNQTHHYCRAQA
jgi:hypothetical protein